MILVMAMFLTFLILQVVFPVNQIGMLILLVNRIGLLMLLVNYQYPALEIERVLHCWIHWTNPEVLFLVWFTCRWWWWLPYAIWSRWQTGCLKYIRECEKEKPRCSVLNHVMIVGSCICKRRFVFRSDDSDPTFTFYLFTIWSYKGKEGIVHVL